MSFSQEAATESPSPVSRKTRCPARFSLALLQPEYINKDEALKLRHFYSAGVLRMELTRLELLIRRDVTARANRSAAPRVRGGVRRTKGCEAGERKQRPQVPRLPSLNSRWGQCSRSSGPRGKEGFFSSLFSATANEAGNLLFIGDRDREEWKTRELRRKLSKLFPGPAFPALNCTDFGGKLAQKLVQCISTETGLG